MLSICIVSAFFPPHLGGVENYTKNLSMSLIKKGCNVTVLTSQIDKEPTIEQNNQMTIVRIPSFILLNNRFPVILPSRSSFALYRMLSSFHFDAVIVNTRYYPLCLFGKKLAKNNSLKLIVIDHSSNYLFLDNSPASKLSRVYEKIMTKLLSKNALYYSVSQKSSDWLKTFGIKTKGLLPNSINPKQYLSQTTKRNWRAELNLKKSDFVVLYAGRLIKEKGILETIDAMIMASDKNPSPAIHLCIAGDGPLSSYIDTIHNSNIHFVGKLENSDLNSLMKVSDVFCFPSTYPEGLPTVLLEAGINSMGIIMTNVGGHDELLPNENYGITLKNNSVDEIQKAIASFYNNRSYLETCGRNILNRILNNYTWDATSSKLLKDLTNY